MSPAELPNPLRPIVGETKRRCGTLRQNNKFPQHAASAPATESALCIFSHGKSPPRLGQGVLEEQFELLHVDDVVSSRFGYFFTVRLFEKERRSDKIIRRPFENDHQVENRSSRLTPSQRELYMAELQKHIDIHVYGKCGTRHCLKESSCPKDCQCEKMIASRYKFYIAFENSVCKDWVTEKIFNRMDRYMVPIVFNRKIYETHIPPDSFIAVDDFDSPAQLADYLKLLDQNDDLYIKYFKWKETYESVSFPDGFHMAFCQLCGRLQADQSMGHIIPSEAAQNISKWYLDRGECISHYVTKHLKLS
ncbi:glyco protein 3-alpha-L-fucosyltransferase A [Trichinella spiralis]|uniref:glyco protein 3-alpha-L-fucosyltransferase A n=1 Tax=Trichinella spiralis TaxID=6334 RepID=UPI0001EFBD76|nr:glyco protein 3-alpha-L-fucosyltransferase A [Trichinella spiralis]